jgi:Putative zincin peptidase
MRFLYAAPPTNIITLQHAVRIQSVSQKTLVIGCMLIGLLAVLLYLCLPQSVVKLKYAVDNLPPLIFIGGLIATLFCHKLIHALAYPHAARILGILPNSVFAYAWCGAPMPRWRYLLVLAAPTAILSGLLIFLIWWMDAPPDWLAYLLPFAVFNLAGCGGDLINMAVVFTRVPHGGWVQLSGMDGYWGAGINESPNV